MLFKFKSKATGDLIMLEPNGRHVLQIIGKDPSVTGIILPVQMPAALAARSSDAANEPPMRRDLTQQRSLDLSASHAR